MSAMLRMLMICNITISACVDVLSGGESSRDAGERPTSDDRASRADTPPSPRFALEDAGMRLTLTDAGGTRGPAARDESDADVDDDADAGSSELGAAIRYDCTQTLRCDAEVSRNEEACISATTRALASADPEALQRFRAIVMRCEALRGCDYVRCALSP